MTHEQSTRNSSSIPLRRALAIAASLERTSWLLRPYIERKATVLMIGAEGTYKSFLALDWAMRVATAGEPVVFLSAEGRGLSKRLRAWSKAKDPNARNGWADTLHKVPFYAVEQPLNLTDAETCLALVEAIDALSIRPALVVIDTLTRNSDGLVERSNEDFLKYLNQVDNALRVKYGASVILVHHVGHAAGDRARGPSALSQATDANFLLTRPDPLSRTITVRAGRMKDCEPPPPFQLEADIVELEEHDEDGRPETSLVLRLLDGVPLPVFKRPSGKHQLQLLADLERRCEQPDELGIWTIEDLRRIARELGMEKSAARAAVIGLQNHGYFQPAVGGSRLQFRPGRNGENREKSGEISPAVGEKREHTPLGVHPFSLPDHPAGLNGGGVA